MSAEAVLSIYGTHMPLLALGHFGARELPCESAPDGRLRQRSRVIHISATSSGRYTMTNFDVAALTVLDYLVAEEKPIVALNLEEPRTIRPPLSTLPFPLRLSDTEAGSRASFGSY